MRVNKPLVCLLGFFLLSFLPVAQAQVGESAIGSDRHLWGGVEFSNFQNDYVKYIRSDGIGIYGDYLITRRVGVEGEVRLLDLNNVIGLTEKTYMAGPIVNIYRYHHFTAYGKILLGVASANYPNNIGYGSYFAYEPGGGVEYRLSPRFKLRGEYDYQLWPGAPGAQLTYPLPSTGLTPSGFSVGISYKIF
jgi:opacity protein-like surface antigen